MINEIVAPNKVQVCPGPDGAWLRVINPNQMIIHQELLRNFWQGEQHRFAKIVHSRMLALLCEFNTPFDEFPPAAPAGVQAMWRPAKEKFIDNPYHPANGWYPKDEADCARMLAKAQLKAANDNEWAEAVEEIMNRLDHAA